MSNDEVNKNKGKKAGPTRSFSDSENKSIGQIGPYRLLSILGEGGFSIVYLAEQDKPVRRRVALKVIKPGMDTKNVIARFEAERQALALLDHPNIAPVYDAGTTEAGLPYFALENVKGIPITEHCDRQKLSIENRLVLFLQVCEAVQYAHQKGIIHRDIKPSNILVSIQADKEIPKIIDFGVAKAITQPLTERTLYTEQGQFIGTPEYMSPEQAEMGAQDIDTRSDVYSLGVLLYELLTGTLPFDAQSLREGGIDSIRQIIRDQDPKRPSTRLTSLGEEAKIIAERRNTDVASLRHRLNRELEWIPLMAMRKDRTRRYRSASELADDIKNYLKGNPLIAGPESAFYRLEKFVRRNQTLVSGITAVLIVLIAGIIVSTIFAVKASQARREAERQMTISQNVSDFLLNDLLASTDPFVTGGEVTIRSFLDAASKQIETRFSEEPLVEASIRNIFGTTYRNTAELESAENNLERAYEIRLDILGEYDPNTLKTIDSLARVYMEQGRYSEAESFFNKAREGFQTVLGSENRNTLESMEGLAQLYFYQGRYDDAESLYRQIHETSIRVFGINDNFTILVMGDLAAIYKFRGLYFEAENFYWQAINQTRQNLGEDHPELLEPMNGLALIYIDEKRYEDANDLSQRALEIGYRVLGNEHPYTLYAMNCLSLAKTGLGHIEEAQRIIDEAILIGDDVLGKNHSTTMMSRYCLATLYKEQGLFPSAESLFLEVLESRKDILGAKHPDTLQTQYSLALLYQEEAQYEKAKNYLIENINSRIEVLGEGHRHTLDSMYALRDVYDSLGETDLADAIVSRIYKIQLGTDEPDTRINENQ